MATSIEDPSADQKQPTGQRALGSPTVRDLLEYMGQPRIRALTPGYILMLLVLIVSLYFWIILETAPVPLLVAAGTIEVAFGLTLLVVLTKFDVEMAGAMLGGGLLLFTLGAFLWKSGYGIVALVGFLGLAMSLAAIPPYFSAKDQDDIWIHKFVAAVIIVVPVLLTTILSPSKWWLTPFLLGSAIVFLPLFWGDLATSISKAFMFSGLTADEVVLVPKDVERDVPSALSRRTMKMASQPFLFAWSLALVIDVAIPGTLAERWGYILLAMVVAIGLAAVAFPAYWWVDILDITFWNGRTKELRQPPFTLKVRSLMGVTAILSFLTFSLSGGRLLEPDGLLMGLLYPLTALVILFPPIYIGTAGYVKWHLKDELKEMRDATEGKYESNLQSHRGARAPAPSPPSAEPSTGTDMDSSRLLRGAVVIAWLALSAIFAWVTWPWSMTSGTILLGLVQALFAFLLWQVNASLKRLQEERHEADIKFNRADVIIRWEPYSCIALELYNEGLHSGSIRGGEVLVYKNREYQDFWEYGVQDFSPYILRPREAGGSTAYDPLIKPGELSGVYLPFPGDWLLDFIEDEEKLEELQLLIRLEVVHGGIIESPLRILLWKEDMVEPSTLSGEPVYYGEFEGIPFEEELGW